MAEYVRCALSVSRSAETEDSSPRESARLVSSPPRKRSVLAPCSLCGLMIGFRREKFQCHLCPNIICQYCVEIGANHVFWCGACAPTTDSLQLAQSAAFIKAPSRIGRNGKVMTTPSPSPDREGSPAIPPSGLLSRVSGLQMDPDQVPKCLHCGQKFNLFNWRKVCEGCRFVVCDKCSKKVKVAPGHEGEALLCVRCVTPRD
jgi:hypothetical protein